MLAGASERSIPRGRKTPGPVADQFDANAGREGSNRGGEGSPERLDIAHMEIAKRALTTQADPRGQCAVPNRLTAIAVGAGRPNDVNKPRRDCTPHLLQSQPCAVVSFAVPNSLGAPVNLFSSCPGPDKYA
jgi:hypothetical protein